MQVLGPYLRLTESASLERGPGAVKHTSGDLTVQLKPESSQGRRKKKHEAESVSKGQVKVSLVVQI